MSENSRNIIGKNVKSIRISLGLSLLNFAILTNLSKATIVNIETGKKGYNLNLLDNIIAFTKFPLSELASKTFFIDFDLRDRLIYIYKNDKTFIEILNALPEIVYAIKYKLLTSDFLDTPKEIREIKKFFENYGWAYRGTSISNSLKRMPDLIEINKHRHKKNTNIYTKKSDSLLD